MKPIFTLAVCLAIICSSYGQDYALKLDGQDDYVELSNFPDVTNNFTVTAWVNTDRRTYGGQRIFIDDRHESSGDGWGFSMSDGGYGILNFYSRTTTPQSLYSPDSLRFAEGVWYFVAAVADIGNHMKYIYINGKLAASTSYTGNWGVDTGKAAIGGININTPTGMEGGWISGEIDNVIFWNKALSHDEINDVMCADADPSQPDIMGIWRFNEGEGSTAADESGNGYDGTLFSSQYTPPAQWVVSTVPDDCAVYTPPNLTVGDLEVVEGTGGTKNAAFVIALDRPSPEPIPAVFTTAQENVNNNDFIPIRLETTIPANTTQFIVNVPIVGDQTDEYTESFLLYIYVPTGVDVRDDRGRCVILDDDIPPGVRVNDTAANEDAGVARVRISLVRPSAKTARVRFNTNNQTALARYDYLSQYQGSVMFAPGETSKYVNITLLNDAVSEPTERLRFILYNPENVRDDEASGGKTIGYVDILDTDNAGAASLVAAGNKATNATVPETKVFPNPSRAGFNIYFPAKSRQPITVRVTDITGRVIESRSGIRAGTTHTFGADWKHGIYFAEIIQENRRRTFRLIKAE